MNFANQNLVEKPDHAIRLLESEKLVMEMIALGRPLSEILVTIALNYEENAEQSICSILLMAEDGIHVKHGAGPSLPKAFNEGIDGEPIGPIAGSCGTAAFKKERVIVDDIATDPLWINYREFALRFGLKSCWSTPILTVNNEVLGTFAIYYKEKRSPDGREFELIDRSASQVKIAIERELNESQLREREAQHRLTLERITDGFASIDKDMCLTYFNKRCAKLLNLDSEKHIGINLYEALPSLQGQPFQFALEVAIKQQKYTYFEDYNAEYDRWFEDHIYPSVEGVTIYFRDVTRKKKESEVLKKSLSRNKAFLDTIPDLTFVIRKDGTISDFHTPPGAQSLLSPEQFLEKTVDKVLPPKLADEIMENVWQVLQNKKVPIHYYQLDYPDGTRDFEARYSVMNDNEVLAIVRDLTTEKQAAEKVRLSEEKFKETLERITDGFVAMDKNWCLTYMNKKAGEIFKLDPAQVVGKNMGTLFPEGVGHSFHHAYKRSMEEQCHVHIEEFYAPYGKWFENNIYPSPDGLSIYFKDITERVKSEKSLKDSELQFRKLTSIAPTAIFQTDVHGRCIFVNETWCKYSGMQFEEAMGYGWSNAIHPADRDWVLQEWQTAVKENREFKSELRFQKKNGKIIWLIAKAVALFDSESEIYGHIGMATDITDQKKVNQLIEQSEERYRTTLTRITDGFVALDNNWRYTYMNKKAGQIFNRNPEEIVGKHIWTEFPEGIGQPFHAAYLNAMLEQEYTYLEEYYEPYDKWFENHIYPSPEGLSIYFKDITDRKRNEEEIMLTKTRLELAEEQALLGNWELGLSGGKRIWSKQMYRIFGFESQDEPPHREILIERVHPEDREEFSSTLAKLFDGFEVEPKVFRTNPSLLPLKYLLPNYRTERDDNGKVIRFIGTIQDITNRIIAEQSLKESEKKYRNLIEQASDGIIQINDEGKIVLVNTALCRMLGYSEVEIMKLDIVETFVESEKSLAKQSLEEAKEKGSLSFERVMIRKDGKVVPAEISISKTETGQLLGIVRDISERKKAELERQHLLLRNLQTINTMLDGFILADQKGNIIEVNPAYSALIGYTRDELINMNINQLDTELSQEEVNLRIANMYDKKSVRLETLHKKKDGKLISIEVSISIMDFGGEALVAAFIRDISERQKVQTELARSNTELRQLASHLQVVREEERANLSRELHDELGQQLTAIKMDLSWVNKRLAKDALSDKIDGTIQLTNEAVSTVRRINSDLRPTMLDDLGLFGALEYQMDEFSKRFNVQGQLVIETEEPKLDRTSEIAIFRVFQEGLTNVAKHAKAKSVKASIMKLGDKIELVICDSGVGFDRTRAGNLKSFGLLGMTERAMMINGSLEIESKPGYGTTLKLTVPLL